MVRRGIAPSRADAVAAIRSGRVTVGGRPAAKAATLVRDDEAIALAKPVRRFVSRGGDKLDAALDRFGIDVSGLRCLDAGASTGGFTQCLLTRGAQHVVALDVGYGQLDWRLREDPRVTVLDRTNARDLVQSALPYAPEVVTADLSFISFSLVVSALVGVAATGARLVLLVKPQFEAGRAEVGHGGVVRDPAAWRRSVERVGQALAASGARSTGVMASPLLGPAGNAEFLVAAVCSSTSEASPLDPTALDAALEEARGMVAARMQVGADV